MPTRAQFETVLIGAAPARAAGRVGALLAGVKFAATGDSPVAALSDAAAVALHACGVTPDDPATPDDDDFARLAVALWWKCLDVAELQLLEAAASMAPATPSSITFQSFSKTLGSSGDVLRRLEAKRVLVRNLWGYGAASLSAGSWRVGPAAPSEF